MFKNINSRHNKLFNDYKTKQYMLNELQQRYLTKEEEKYTFYPIINNYIIKYNRPYFPSIQNTDMYSHEPPLTYKYFNNTKNTNNHNKIKNNNSTIQEFNSPYIYTENQPNKSLKKSFNKKNGCFASNRDEINNNKMFKKIDKYNISNLNRYNKNIQKNNNKSTLYDNKTNIYGNNNTNIINGINLNQDMNLPNQRDTFSEEKKVIQKTNSIKTFLSNKSPVNKESNTKKNKSKYKKKDINNLIKMNIPLEELNSFNYNVNLPIKKSHMGSMNTSGNYINKKKVIKNNYNKTNIIEGLSLKYLIQDEKAKKNIKQKNSKNISIEKANEIIDNIFNNNKKLKRSMINNNNLMINVDDYNLGFDLNENQNNIRIQSENFFIIKDKKDSDLIKNKNIKTESNYKKININNKYNRINGQKSYEKGNNTNSRTIALTEKQAKENKNYYNKNTFNKKCNTSIGENDGLNTLKKNKLLYKPKGKEYKEILPNDNNNNKNSKKIKNNYTNNIQNIINSKENTIPIPAYNKLNILNKITDSKRDIKSTLIDEVNNKRFLYNKYKYKKINDFNQTNNDETNQTLLSKENRINTFSNNNTQTIDDEKTIFSLNEKRYDNIYNNNLINNKNRKNDNERISKINSFNIEQNNNNNLKNKKNNNYIIPSHEINEYYSKLKKDNGNNLDDFDYDESDLSIQSLSDSKVFEIANTYVDELVDKNQVCDILTHKRKKNQYSYYEK